MEGNVQQQPHFCCCSYQFDAAFTKISYAVQILYSHLLLLILYGCRKTNAEFLTKYIFENLKQVQFTTGAFNGRTLRSATNFTSNFPVASKRHPEFRGALAGILKYIHLFEIFIKHFCIILSVKMLNKFILQHDFRINFERVSMKKKWFCSQFAALPINSNSTGGPNIPTTIRFESKKPN